MRTPLLALSCVLAVSSAALAQNVAPTMTMPMAQPAPAVSNSAVPSPAPSPALIVHTKDFAYLPKEAKVNVGDTILFVNDDESAHTITADEGSFDSGYMPKDAKWSYTFTKPGTFAYFCTYHKFMRASITVAPK